MRKVMVLGALVAALGWAGAAHAADKPGVYGYKCKPHYGMGLRAQG